MVPPKHLGSRPSIPLPFEKNPDSSYLPNELSHRVEHIIRANNPPPTECAKSAQCAPLKHHYDACAERVTKQHENPDHKGPKEDCVEECEFDGHPYAALE